MQYKTIWLYVVELFESRYNNEYIVQYVSEKFSLSNEWIEQIEEDLMDLDNQFEEE